MSATAPDAGLLGALLAVQRDAPTLPKDATNPHFRSKYVPLDTIVEKVGPLLAANGLVWSALPCRDEHGDPALRYRLAHAATGEVLEGVMPLLLTKADPQGMGSAITYARRYSLCAVLNLVADEDDDGNAGSNSNGQGARMGGTPATDKQKTAIRRYFTQYGLKWGDIKALFARANVPVTTDDPGALVDGLLKHQASALLDLLKDGAVPAAEPSDVPSDLTVFDAPAADSGERTEAIFDVGPS